MSQAEGDLCACPLVHFVSVSSKRRNLKTGRTCATLLPDIRLSSSVTCVDGRCFRSIHIPFLHDSSNHVFWVPPFVKTPVDEDENSSPELVRLRLDVEDTKGYSSGFGVKVSEIRP